MDKLPRALNGGSHAAGRKSNKAFMLLSALGILFVVDNHLGHPLGFFTTVFPYDSFFMPMFVFISGYFFRSSNCESRHALQKYVTGKFQKMLLPYFGWILFYGILTGILRYFHVFEIGKIALIDLVQNIFTTGTSFGFNDPAWFVPLLFCVTTAYSVFYKLFSGRWNDYTVMILLALIGALAILGAQTGFRTNNTYMLLKVPFFLQFYHLGVLFRNKLEALFDKMSTWVICISAMAVNMFLLSFYGYETSFPMYASMSVFYPSNPFLPLMTSVTGIAFWLKIAKLLVPALGENMLVNYISEHTAFIMTHHLGIKHLFTGLMVIGANHGLSCFSGIDVQAFRTDVWYCYTDVPWVTFACLLCTMLFLILACRLTMALKTCCITILQKKRDVC